MRRARLLAMETLGDLFVLECEDRLDEARYACGRLQMADVAFHGAYRARPIARPVERQHLAQRASFDRITEGKFRFRASSSVLHATRRATRRPL